MEITVKAHGIEADLSMENQEHGIRFMLQDGSGECHQYYVCSYDSLKWSVTSFYIGIVLDHMMQIMADEIRDKQVADAEDLI